MTIIYGVIFLVLGLLIGSFLNVVIYRYPKKESIVYPNSHCPKCKKALKWYHNIPLFSYLFLRGRCAYCKEKISLRYPLVEFLTGVLFLLSYLMLGLSYDLIFYFIFIVMTLLIAFIDYDEKIIPDLFLLILLFTGVSYFIFNIITVEGFNYWNNIIGFFAGFVPFYLIRKLATVIYQREAMGFGDVKYMGVIGFFLGWGNVLLIILIASLTASITLITLIKLKRREKSEEFAFGPYLVFASLIALLYGEVIIDFYLSLLNIR